MIPFALSIAASTDETGISNWSKTTFADSKAALALSIFSWDRSLFAPGLTIIELFPSLSTPIIAIPVGIFEDEKRNSQSTFAFSKFSRIILPSWSEPIQPIKDT